MCLGEIIQRQKNIFCKYGLNFSLYQVAVTQRHTKTSIFAVFERILRYTLTERSLHRNGGSVAVQNSLRCASKQPPLCFKTASVVLKTASVVLQNCLRCAFKTASVVLQNSLP